MRDRREQITIVKKKYTIVRLMGERKNGYLYQVTDGKNFFMMKEFIDTELPQENPADAFTAAVSSYEKLKELKIRVPRLVCADEKKQILVKEFIDGNTASASLLNGEMDPTYLEQLRKMALHAEAAGCCLDYFPTNFVLKDQKLYYTHYGCRPFQAEYSFENLVGRYWLSAASFLGLYSRREKEALDYFK